MTEILFDAVRGTAENPTIIEAGDSRYLDEVLKKPENYADYYGILPAGVLDKTLADAGGTYAALNSNANYIIVVPTKSLRNSIARDWNCKKSSFEFVSRAYCRPPQGTEQQDKYRSRRGRKKYSPITKYLTEYLKEDGYKKIICVYDSFPSVVETLIEEGINLDDYNVLVDEYQVLLTAIGYRQQAITELINALKGFNHITYMSATPIKPEYEIQELRDLPHYKVHWNRQMDIHLKNISFDSRRQGFNMICNMVKQVVDGTYMEISDRGIKEQVETLHIFLNSVKAISSICETCCLLPEQARICISKSNKGKLPEYLSKFEICYPSSEIKTINFYTSCAYEGCNIFCNNGLVIVYSDGDGKGNMLNDISTDLVQIAGRLREKNGVWHNIFRENLYHFYNKSNRVSTQEELNEIVSKFDDETQKILDMQDKMSPEQRQDFSKRIGLKDSFCLIDGNEIIRSEMMRNHLIYKNQLRLMYQKNMTIAVANDDSAFRSSEEVVQHKVQLSNDLSATKSFETNLKKCYEQSDSSNYNILCLYPELVEIKKYLSLEQCHSLGFNKERCMEVVKSRKLLEKFFLSDSFTDGFYTPKLIVESFTHWIDLNREKLMKESTNFENILLIKDLNKGKSRKLTNWFLSQPAVVITKTKHKRVNGYIIKYPKNKIVGQVKFGMCLDSGINQTIMRTTNWNEIIDQSRIAKDKKEQRLISEGYNPKNPTFTRSYSTDALRSFSDVDCMILDIDNKNEHIMTIDEFKEKYGEYDYVIYTTWSYTDEKNCYRVIIPLDRTLSVLDCCSLYVKAKQALFPECDKKCTMYYFGPAPHSEIIENRGKRFERKTLDLKMVELQYEDSERADKIPPIQLQSNGDENGRQKYIDKCIETINSTTDGNTHDTIFRVVSNLKDKFPDNQWVGQVRSHIVGEKRKREYDYQVKNLK